jgi:hypothetical protein
MAPKARATPSRALEGEDLTSSHWEDARHWMSIYADLLEFKRGILDRVRRDVAGLQPLARKAAEADVQIIEDQMLGYQARLDLWYGRIWELHRFAKLVVGLFWPLVDGPSNLHSDGHGLRYRMQSAI